MLQQNISLKEYSNYKIGGLADYFSIFKTKDELNTSLVEWSQIHGAMADYFVIGGATNILFSDEGFRGLILKDEINFIELQGDEINAGAGSLIEDLTAFCIQHSLGGLEWAGGLPGTVGGAVRGNAGAFGGETKDHISEVISFDPKTSNTNIRTNLESGFSYRSSVFKKGNGEGEIITSAKFKVVPGNRDEIERLTREKKEYREERHPLDLPNIGSTFKNVDWEEVPQSLKPEMEQYIKTDPFPILPVAKLLSLLGLKGKSIGGAMISDKHPNFIVNANNASAKDVKELIKFAKDEVRQKYGIELEEEVIYL